MPLKEAIDWEEARAIASAKVASASCNTHQPAKRFTEREAETLPFSK